MLAPLQYLGEGQFQAPRGHASRLDKGLVIGEILQWEQINPRSMKSHKHYFAVIADAWGNLPEVLAFEIPSPEHLRKRALIKAGYCIMKKVICASNWEAMQACAMMADMDDYAMFEVSDRVLTVWRAKSQSVRAMGAKEFQVSKEKVLDAISVMIGADATQAGMAA